MSNSGTTKAQQAGISLDVLNLLDSTRALYYAMDSDQPIMLIGPPGVGKSAIIEMAAGRRNMKVESLLLSQCDPTDIGGFPTVRGDGLDRLPLGAVKLACDEPIVLFLDELSCAPPAVQGAALQLIYNRRAGDRRLHPGTRIVAACNPADQAAGGWEIALPLIGRLTMIWMRPKVAEIQDYFFGLGIDPNTVGDAPKKPADTSDVKAMEQYKADLAAYTQREFDAMVRRIAVDFAATVDSSPDLLQIDPPPSAQAEGKPWGAPRSWERAIKFCAAALVNGEADNSPVFAAGLAGNVGETAAMAYMAIRKVRNKLPGVKDILNDAYNAKLPPDKSIGIAVLGILGQVALEDPCAAWVYANRLQDKEIRVASMNLLGNQRFGIKPHKGKSKYFVDADKAQTALLRDIGDALRR